ncbi:MAG: helix-turn-helix domain-containing protein [Lachnospiraceae bacterium]|nr:helix-turn-helix domain-containing protein [Lachnospiraceae bacterium]
MNDSANTFGKMIRQARTEQQLTLYRLAEKLNTSAAYLRTIENGTHTPSLDLFCRIIRALHLSADAYIYASADTRSDTYLELLQLLSKCDEEQLGCLLKTAAALTGMPKDSNK